MTGGFHEPSPGRRIEGGSVFHPLAYAESILCLAKTLADSEINDIAGGRLPEFGYNSEYAQRALAHVQVGPSHLP